MSARSRAKPWFRDERWAAIEFVLGTFGPAQQADTWDQLADSPDLWKQPGGDPVADMKTAIERLCRW